jgi:hypothetical protein
MRHYFLRKGEQFANERTRLKTDHHSSSLCRPALDGDTGGVITLTTAGFSREARRARVV